MAGNYPDEPSSRMAHDKDGTRWIVAGEGGSPRDLTPTEVALLNSERVITSSTPQGVHDQGNPTILAAIFPEKRDLAGYFFRFRIFGSGGTQNLVFYGAQSSADTTNGLDGNWSDFAGASATDSTALELYRTGIQSASRLGIRGVRFRYNNKSRDNLINNVHLYGTPSPGANIDRLDLWHPTLDEVVPPAYFDWGDVPRGSSEDRLFRVKNRSATLTANDVTIGVEALTDASPSVPAQHTLSHNGGSFLGQIDIGSLAPGAISLPVTLRRVTPTNAQLWIWAARVFAESDDWQV